MNNRSFTRDFRDLLYLACEPEMAEQLLASIHELSESKVPDEIDLHRLRERFGGIPSHGLCRVRRVGRALAHRISQRTFERLGVPTTIHWCPRGGEEQS